MKKVNIHEAKSRLSAILRDIENGETYIICKNGKPIADISPHDKKKRTALDPVISKIEVKYDPTEELSSGEWGKIL